MWCGVVDQVRCLPFECEDVTLILRTHMGREAGSGGTRSLVRLLLGKQKEADAQGFLASSPSIFAVLPLGRDPSSIMEQGGLPQVIDR